MQNPKTIKLADEGGPQLRYKGSAWIVAILKKMPETADLDSIEVLRPYEFDLGILRADKH